MSLLHVRHAVPPAGAAAPAPTFMDHAQNLAKTALQSSVGGALSLVPFAEKAATLVEVGGVLTTMPGVLRMLNQEAAHHPRVYVHRTLGLPMENEDNPDRLRQESQFTSIPFARVGQVVRGNTTPAVKQRVVLAGFLQAIVQAQSLGDKIIVALPEIVRFCRKVFGPMNSTSPSAKWTAQTFFELTLTLATSKKIFASPWLALIVTSLVASEMIHPTRLDEESTRILATIKKVCYSLFLLTHGKSSVRQGAVALLVGAIASGSVGASEYLSALRRS
jgi:hypothetical protein